jgi:hypothetical protein
VRSADSTASIRPESGLSFLYLNDVEIAARAIREFGMVIHGKAKDDAIVHAAILAQAEVDMILYGGTRRDEEIPVKVRVIEDWIAGIAHPQARTTSAIKASKA